MKPDLVLDCSITMSWCFEDESNEYSDRVLEFLSHAHAIVPTIWPLEVANVLLIAKRKKRITEHQLRAFLKDLSFLPIKIDNSSTHRALDDVYEIAKQTHLTIYDAAYIDLAIKEKIPLATKDNALLKAARLMQVELVH
jgi:predicted nucleic acid-binding protein